MADKRYNVDGRTILVSFILTYHGIADYQTWLDGQFKRVSVDPALGICRVYAAEGTDDEVARVEAVRRFRLDEYADFLKWHCAMKATLVNDALLPFDYC